VQNMPIKNDSNDKFDGQKDGKEKECSMIWVVNAGMFFSVFVAAFALQDETRSYAALVAIFFLLINVFYYLRNGV
jgi:hypothetical protein